MDSAVKQTQAVTLAAALRISLRLQPPVVGLRGAVARTASGYVVSLGKDLVCRACVPKFSFDGFYDVVSPYDVAVRFL